MLMVVDIFDQLSIHCERLHLNEGFKMYTNLLTTDQTVDYSVKEAGPIVVALAFVIAVGGLAAAAIIICGWRGVKSMGVNLSQRRVEIVCR